MMETFIDSNYTGKWIGFSYVEQKRNSCNYKVNVSFESSAKVKN